MMLNQLITMEQSWILVNNSTFLKNFAKDENYLKAANEFIESK